MRVGIARIAQDPFQKELEYILVSRGVIREFDSVEDAKLFLFEKRLTAQQIEKSIIFVDLDTGRYL